MNNHLSLLEISSLFIIILFLGVFVFFILYYLFSISRSTSLEKIHSKISKLNHREKISLFNRMKLDLEARPF